MLDEALGELDGEWKARILDIIAESNTRSLGQGLHNTQPLSFSRFSSQAVWRSRRSSSGCKLDDETTRKAIAVGLWKIHKLPEWKLEAIEGLLREVAERLAVKFRDVVRPFYVAITGSPTSVPLFNATEILGRDICRERLRAALQLLGGVSKAEEREWQGKV